MVASDGGIFDFGDAALLRLGRRRSADRARRRHGGPAGRLLDRLRRHRSAQHRARARRGAGRPGVRPARAGRRWDSSGVGRAPGHVAAIWSPGRRSIARGEIMAFEAEVGLPIDGTISTAEINALQAAAADPTGPGPIRTASPTRVANETNPEIARPCGSTGSWSSRPRPTRAERARRRPRARSRSTCATATRSCRAPIPTGRPMPTRCSTCRTSTEATPLHYMPRVVVRRSRRASGCVELHLNSAAIAWQYLQHRLHRHGRLTGTGQAARSMTTAEPTAR